MKKSIYLPLALLAFFAMFNITNSYGQANCNGKKTGIAIVRTEGETPEVPTAAMKFPAYEKGPKAMCSYICKNMKYPEELKRQNVKGVVTVGFVVKSNGSIAEVEVVKPSGQKAFDDEAVRIVQSFPNWKPAEKDCEPIDFKSQLDIEFDCEKCGCK